ncbi:hypothetical protein OURE66S_01472 [Oligella ureolytica]
MQTIGVNAIDAAQSHLNLPLYVPNQGGASSLFQQTNQRLELKIEQLTMELATLRRISFAKRSEQLPDLQARLFEEDALADIAEVEAKLRT